MEGLGRRRPMMRFKAQQAALAKGDIVLPMHPVASAAIEEIAKAVGEPIAKSPKQWPLRGSCPKCHQYIGRGIGFHVKRCKG